MPASVVVFPEPVGPVTRISPRGCRASAATGSGSPEFGQRDGADGHPPQHHPDVAALTEGVHAESADPVDHQREVGLPGLLELIDQVGAKDLRQHPVGVRTGQRIGAQRTQCAVHADPGYDARLDVQIRPGDVHQGA